jgi:hypothetical protein
MGFVETPRRQERRRVAGGGEEGGMFPLVQGQERFRAQVGSGRHASFSGDGGLRDAAPAYLAQRREVVAEEGNVRLGIQGTIRIP